MSVEFVPGLIARAPNERAPDFVKVSLSVKVAELGVWLREQHKAGAEWVNIEVRESKGGKWYAAVRPAKQKEPEEPKPAPRKGGSSRVGNGDIEDEIPF